MQARASLRTDGNAPAMAPEIGPSNASVICGTIFKTKSTSEPTSIPGIGPKSIFTCVSCLVIMRVARRDVVHTHTHTKKENGKFE